MPRMDVRESKIGKFRYHVLNDEGKTLFTSTTNYRTRSIAENAYHEAEQAVLAVRREREGNFSFLRRLLGR